MTAWPSPFFLPPDDRGIAVAPARLRADLENEQSKFLL
jgi:hypothetical protein